MTGVQTCALPICIIAALEDCAGNQTRAARALGMARTTLANKLGLYRIPRPRT